MGAWRRNWPRGVRLHIRRRIAAWRKRGFQDDEIRIMAHELRSAGPKYTGPSVPRAELERNATLAHAHNSGHDTRGHHGHGPARTAPDKHPSKYRAKHR